MKGPDAPDMVQELTRQLVALRKREGLADETALSRRAPRLVELAAQCYPVADGEPFLAAPRALDLLRAGMAALSPSSKDLVATSFNLDGSLPETLDLRLRGWAQAHELAEIRNLQTRERELCRALAEFIYEEVALRRARASHQAMARGDGDATAATMFVVDQFRHYYRVYTPVWATQANLGCYLARRAGGSNADLQGYLAAAINEFAQWQAALLAFVVEAGGNWTASSTDMETAIVNAEYEARLLLPFGEAQISQMRLALTAAGSELEPFARAIGARRHRGWIARMQEWADTCSCNPRRPRAACEPHRHVRIAKRFCIIIDREWSRYGAWYQLPSDIVSAEVDPSRDYWLSQKRAGL